MITPSELERFKNHINKKAGGYACAVCKHNSFTVYGPVGTSTVEIQFSLTYFSSPIYPTIMSVCDNCFFVQHFLWLPFKDQP